MDIDSYARKTLREELKLRQKKNESYSMRAFARDLDISPGYLWDFTSGKRSLSEKNARKIAQILKMNQDEQKSFVLSSQCKKNDYQKGGELYQLISYWHHFAVLNLSKDPMNEATPKWVAKRLLITEEEAKTALELLIETELITIVKGKMISFERDNPKLSLEEAAFSKIDMNFFNKIILRLKQKKLMKVVSDLVS